MPQQRLVAARWRQIAQLQHDIPLRRGRAAHLLVNLPRQRVMSTGVTAISRRDMREKSRMSLMSCPMRTALLPMVSV